MIQLISLTEVMKFFCIMEKNRRKSSSPVNHTYLEMLSFWSISISPQDTFNMDRIGSSWRASVNFSPWASVTFCQDPVPQADCSPNLIVTPIH